jgi:hypothetical protein
MSPFVTVDSGRDGREPALARRGFSIVIESSTFRPRVLWFTCVAALSLVAACGSTEEEESAPADVAGAVPADDRTFTSMDQFVAGYWDRPIPPQGDPPDAFSPLEASLQPEDCGTCHPAQYADWQTTVHSGAYSPGLSGQLVNWEASAFGTVSSCLVCHAPLSEQSAELSSADEWLTNPAYDSGLRDAGVSCGACHVRAWRRHGPPRRDGSFDPSPQDSPHGGVTRTGYFEDSRFCSGCHQFGPGGAAPNGKPLENTLFEWQNSRYATEGIVCQTCHMPDRRHLWRGIHDPDMVRSGVTIEWLPAGREVGLRITNTGTGHRFPTYATPEVVARLEFLDGEARPIEGAEHEHSIARRIGYEGGVWVEHSDTRLAPDSAVVVTAAVPGGAHSVRGSVIVRPDAFYGGVFRSLLSGMLSDTSRALLTEAQRRAEDSEFPIFDETVPLAR